MDEPLMSKELVILRRSAVISLNDLDKPVTLLPAITRPIIAYVAHLSMVDFSCMFMFVLVLFTAADESVFPPAAVLGPVH